LPKRAFIRYNLLTKIKEIFMLKEFKEFALKGNVVDLAVGVIIGAAFGKIVTSLVDDILMPIFGIFMGGINFTNLKFVITQAQGDVPESAIMYGTFIQNIINFLIIAFSIFLMVKAMNAFKRKEEAKEEEKPVEKPADVVLLEEIRDLLQK
jgi:large conductance mechanosensitive channel protein